MSLIKSIKNTFRGWGKKAEKSLSDPKRDVQIAIDDSQKQINTAETAIAKVIATNKGIERKIEGYERDSEKYLNLAKQAKANNDLENARVLFDKHKTANIAIGQSRVILEQNKKVVDQKRAQINTWKSNLQQAIATKDAFDLRHQMVEATSSINDLNMADKNGNGIPDHLEDAMDALQREEDILSAKEEINRDPALEAEMKYKYSANDSDFDKFLSE